MTNDNLCKDRRRELAKLGSLLVALAFLVLPTTGWADSEADNLEFIIVSDDINKQVTNVARPEGSESSPASPDAGADDDGTTSKTNHGHGNNADGVDSSNPGQGQGGPTGAVDPSGDVDDEAGGGGAAPSKDKGRK